MPPVRLRFAHGSGAGVGNLNPTAAAVEMHVSVDQRIEREIAPLTNPSARVKAVADLADEDVSGSHLLTAESFHAETLRIGVASVPAGALSFFVCHEITSPREQLRGPIGVRKRNALLIKGLRYGKPPGRRVCQIDSHGNAARRTTTNRLLSFAG